MKAPSVIHHLIGKFSDERTPVALMLNGNDTAGIIGVACIDDDETPTLRRHTTDDDTLIVFGFYRYDDGTLEPRITYVRASCVQGICAVPFYEDEVDCMKLAMDIASGRASPNVQTPAAEPAPPVGALTETELKELGLR